MAQQTLWANAGCPFARRGILAMELKGLADTTTFRPIPLSGQLKAMQENGLEAVPSLAKLFPGKTAEEIVQIKEDYKRDVNPTGEVPSLTTPEGHVVSEADVVAEYLEDAFPALGASLKPKDDALAQSKIRHYIKIMNADNGVRAMYGVLMNQDPEKDAEIAGKMHKGLSEFARLADNDGPFFLGDAVSLADVMLMPFFDQFRHILPHYRGVDMIPSGADDKFPWAPRLRKWAEAVDANAAFQKSRVDAQQVIAGYVGYAGARGVDKK